MTQSTDHVRLGFDAAGHLAELRDRRTGHNYAGGGHVWRLYLQRGETLDREVVPTGTPTVDTLPDGVRLHWPTITCEGEELPIAVSVTALAEADTVTWRLAVANEAPETIVRDAHFPLLGNVQPAPDQDFIWTVNGGQRYRQEELRAALGGPKLYKAMDHVFRDLLAVYPGNAALNCFVLAGPEHGLYIGGHLPEIAWTDHQVRLYDDRELELGMVRYLNLRPGQQCTLGDFVTAPYAGTWHVAADRYRAWAESWWTPPEPPVWVRRLNGWQRVIMKHQYGEIHYRFADLERMFAEGRQAGIDALLMFGWQRGGHDNNYPDYFPDPELGTPEEMAAGIAAVQAAGGHVMIYSNGRLIDVASDYYRNGPGPQVSVKDRLGVEHREAYRFRGLGNFVHHFGNRTLVNACPSTETWFGKLVEIADTALTSGAHSVFYDQMGSSEPACSDPDHPHPPEWLGAAAAKARSITRLRTLVRSLAPEMAIGIELLADVGAGEADYIHALTGACEALNDWDTTGEKPRLRGMVEFFRYAFPEVVLSDREIRDDTDIERRVNHALLKGLRSDVEIYRCRRTIAETPRYQTYLARANTLRQRQARFLLEGRYRDTLDFTCDNAEVDARGFLAGDLLAVVATQSHLREAAATIRAPGFTFIDHDGIGDPLTDRDGDGVRVRLERHALAVLIFAPNQE